MRKTLLTLTAVFMLVPAYSADFSSLEKMTGQDVIDISRNIEIPGVDMEKNKPKFSKIVGGVPAQKGEFPFIVSLRHRYYGHYCGGSLIKSDWVLTAAHCVDGISPAAVSIGLYKQSDTENVEKIKPVRIIKHPKWNKSNMSYDFALIKLEKNSSYTPVPLNEREITGSAVFTTAGWGTTSEGGSLSRTLLKVDVPFVSRKKCSEAYPGWINDSMICAGFEKGGKDACQGDSGGPLVIRKDGKTSLVGVVSWGEGCARPNKPGVYSKVSKAVNWVEKTIKENP